MHRFALSSFGARRGRAILISRSIARVAIFAALAIVTALANACGDSSHVYQGRLYREDRRCLGTTSSVDVVTGDDPGSCAPICLIQTTSDGGRAVYVSTMCAPYPHNFEASGTDAVCPDALAAFARDDACFTDGGSKNPVPSPDASADASTDSPTD